MKFTSFAVPALAILLAAGSEGAVALEQISGSPTAVSYDQATGRVRLTNGRLELVIDTHNGLNPSLLRDRLTGVSYADSDYVWPGGVLPEMVGAPGIKNSPDGGVSVTFNGRIGALSIKQVFRATPETPDGIVETVTLGVTGQEAFANPKLHMGFAKTVRTGEAWTRDAERIRYCGVPYRRETDGSMGDYPLKHAVEHPCSYQCWGVPPSSSPTWGSEGWVWSTGDSSLLITKFNPDAMEWSLLAPVKCGHETVLCFGGAGVWKKGSPQAAMSIAPGKSFTFGETLLQAVDGDWKAGYYAYRRYTEAKGCCPHPGYDPPVHWNEIYDNAYFGAIGSSLPALDSPALPDFLANGNRKLLNDIYSLAAMKGEAAKAKELGCEALYLDPGWDTGPSHHVWDTERLGSTESFLELMRKDYGLKTSIWIGLAGAPPTFADATVLPKEAWRMDRDGTRPKILCVCSPAFREAKKKLLIDLARKGIAFMMFDSTQFSGPCYDPTHGHSIPSTEEEHADAVFDILHAVKQASPKLLIELHDPVTGPGSAHYTPTYLYYTRKNSFDCIWGQEFMWDSMSDLVSGRALSLYYYNLAYSLPIYLHVSLKADNANALVFWWYASTCRHLGVGGKSQNPAVWEAQKAAMRAYLPLKQFYTQGEFYGLDETIHAHTLAAKNMSVVNVFNLTDEPTTRTCTFKLSDVGLGQGQVNVDGADVQQSGDQITLHVTVPAKGHALVKLRLRA